jgi:hypothetical protein
VRLRVLLVVALAALAVPSAASARTATKHGRSHGQAARIAGTWDVKVTPDGAPPFAALVTFTRDGSVIETESDMPGTGLGSWKRIGHNRFAFAFKTFEFSATGDANGYVVVRAVVTLSHGTLSGPFKFDEFDPAGHVVQSGSGTATATRFAIPRF